MASEIPEAEELRTALAAAQAECDRLRALADSWCGSYEVASKERDRLRESAVVSNLFINAVGNAASDTGWRCNGDMTPGIADWIRLIAAERDTLRGQHSVEKHWRKDADDLLAEVEAERDRLRAALAECVGLLRGEAK